jgi:hypothetical protein
MEYDARVWGPSYWFFLDNIAFTYPSHPNDIIRKKYYEVIQNLPLFIPDYEISKNFQELLNLYPIKTYLDNKKSLIKWVHFIHNKINEKLDKPQITMEEYYNEFYGKYEKRPTKKFIRIKKYTIFLVLSLLLICIIFYFL